MRILSSTLLPLAALALVSHTCGGSPPSPPASAATASRAPDPDAPRGPTGPSSATETPPPSPSALSSAFETPRIEEVPVRDDLPAFVVRGARRHALSVVFLAGMCGHPGGYLASFPWTAILHGDVVGVQGDVPCANGGGRRWSYDLVKVDRRIESAYWAAGLGTPYELTIVGYSQGAEIAERLAAKFPERYKRVVILSSPIPSTAERLGHARGVLFGIGEYEARARTLANVAALEHANVPTGWFVLPGAHHGQMGTDAGRIMGDVLTWLEEPELAAPSATIRTIRTNRQAGGHNSAAATTDRR